MMFFVNAPGEVCVWGSTAFGNVEQCGIPVIAGRFSEVY
jgi:hypothetical protein